MNLGTLLNALIQGSETGTIAQVAARVTNPSSSITGQQTALPGNPIVAAQPNAGSSFTAGGAATTGNAAAASGLTVATGQPGVSVAFQPGGGASIAANGLSVTVTQQPVNTFTTLAATTADVYHGAGEPASPSLAGQSGVGAYIQLLSALATNESDEKSAQLLTNNLGNASATLRSAYNDAVAGLPPQLQGKDWGFSISNGQLVFSEGEDTLTPQDLAVLQKAFGNSNVADAARTVAAAIATIEAKQNDGVDSGSLAWGRLADDDNNTAAGNLRDFVTGTAPGSRYAPAAVPDPARMPAEIPNVLGGMDLRNLVSAQPKFFRPDGRVVTEEDEDADFEAPSEAVQAGTLQGQCACGQVHFVVEDAFEYAYYCHCSRCRLRTGSAFAAIAGIGIDKVQVTAGTDALLVEGECSDGYGARCGRCHTFLFSAVRERQFVHISLGTLTDAPTKVPDHHVYVGSKAPWFEIADALPQHDELP